MDLFTEIETQKKTELPAKLDLSETGLMAEVVAEGEKFSPQNIMLKELNYEEMLNPDKVDQQFVSLFEEVMIQAGERGHEISINPEGKQFSYNRTPKDFTLYRHNPEHISKLIEYISTVHNPKALYLATITLDPPLPSMKEFKINKDAERCERTTLHLSYDIETNQHQKLYHEKYQDMEIYGGVLGSLYAEAKRYVEFKHTRFAKEKQLDLFHDQNGNDIILMKGTDPLEAIMISMIEVEIAAILLSALAQNHQDLISIFQEI